MELSNRRGATATAAVALVSALLVVPVNPAWAAIGPWASTTSYPIQVAGDACVERSDTVYCVGGFDANGHDYTNTYYAALSPTGIGNWTPTTPYPEAVDSSGCAVWSSTIYCVGGENATNVLSNVYEAPLSASGIGKWTGAGAYPQTIAATKCITNAGYIYCIGGFDLTGDETNAVYYSSLSNGLSSWSKSAPYPLAINSESCVVQNSTVYCVAGNEESGLPQFPTANVEWAPLGPTGAGPWTQTWAYPNALSAVSCVLQSIYIYCAGGFNLNAVSSNRVYYTSIVSVGVSPWVNATVYPTAFDDSSCVSDFSNMYCVAGRTYSGGSQIHTVGVAYYAPLSGPASSTTSTASSTGASSTSSTVPEFSGWALFLAMLVSATLVAVVGPIRARARATTG